jgi:hypothetical protein
MLVVLIPVELNGNWAIHRTDEEIQAFLRQGTEAFLGSLGRSGEPIIINKVAPIKPISCLGVE